MELRVTENKKVKKQEDGGTYNVALKASGRIQMPSELD